MRFVKRGKTLNTTFDEMFEELAREEERQKDLNESDIATDTEELKLDKEIKGPAEIKAIIQNYFA